MCRLPIYLKQSLDGIVFRLQNKRGWVDFLINNDTIPDCAVPLDFEKNRCREGLFQLTAYLFPRSNLQSCHFHPTKLSKWIGFLCNSTFKALISVIHRNKNTDNKHENAQKKFEIPVQYCVKLCCFLARPEACCMRWQLEKTVLTEQPYVHLYG